MTGPVGIGKTETETVKDGAGAAEGPGPLGSSVGNVEFAGALAALESSGRADAGISHLPAASGAAEIGTAEIAMGAG